MPQMELLKMGEENPDILSLLGKHELVLKQLYETFAAKFAEHQSFWRDLAVEEQKHSDWLETLRVDSVVNKYLLNDIQLKPQAVKSSIEYVERQIAKAQEGGFGLLQAFSIARDLEEALIEKQFLKLSRSASKEIRLIFTELVAETERHRDALIKAINAEKH
jgi:rubrerythrin